MTLLPKEIEGEADFGGSEKCVFVHKTLLKSSKIGIFGLFGSILTPFWPVFGGVLARDARQIRPFGSGGLKKLDRFLGRF